MGLSKGSIWPREKHYRSGLAASAYLGGSSSGTVSCGAALSNMTFWYVTLPGRSACDTVAVPGTGGGGGWWDGTGTATVCGLPPPPPPP